MGDGPAVTVDAVAADVGDEEVVAGEALLSAARDGISFGGVEERDSGVVESGFFAWWIFVVCGRADEASSSINLLEPF